MNFCNDTPEMSPKSFRFICKRILIVMSLGNIQKERSPYVCWSNIQKRSFAVNMNGFFLKDLQEVLKLQRANWDEEVFAKC